MRYIDKVTSLYLGWSKVVGGGVGSERITARVWVLLFHSAIHPPNLRLAESTGTLFFFPTRHAQ